jgi:glycosyltransferase involved in cell wall biosynthesis
MEKVLFVIDTLEFGGLEIVLLDWLSAIEYSKVSAVVCTRLDVLPAKLAEKRLPVEIVKLAITDDEPFWKAYQKWLRLLSSIRPAKIVFVESGVGEFSLMAILAAWWSTPDNVFLFEANWARSPIHPPFSAKRRKLHYGFLPGIGLYRYKEIFRQRLRGRLARHTFVVSQGIKDNLFLAFGYPAGRTSILYHGVDTGRFQPSLAERLAYRRAHGIPDSATVMVSHGRLAPRKHVDRILKTFEILSGEHDNLWLLLTAYGPLKEKVEKIVADSDAHRRVKLVGFQEDVSRMLKASDIYVLASDDEGFGIALVEALSAGLICVSTSGPGPMDIIVNGENGFLVEATGEGLLAGLRRALSLHQDERDRLVQRARKTVEDRFEICTAIRTALDSMEIPRR